MERWSKKGYNVLDDSFGTDYSYEQTVQLALEVKCDLSHPKSDKCIWDPVQKMDWLGSYLYTHTFSTSISERRIYINKALDLRI